MPTSSPVLVYHLWPCAGFRDVHQKILALLKESDLPFPSPQNSYVGFAGPSGLLESAGLHDFTVWQLEHWLSEAPTLQRLHALAKSLPPETPILYLHCKGAKYKRDSHRFQPIADWVDMMLYFLVERWPEALKRLETHDAVGCDLRPAPQPGLKHFSGNFWLAKAGALARLDDVPLFPTWAHSEMWIGGLGPEKMYEIYRSPEHINHYHSLWPREKYVGC